MVDCDTNLVLISFSSPLPHICRRVGEGGTGTREREGPLRPGARERSFYGIPMQGRHDANDIEKHDNGVDRVIGCVHPGYVLVVPNKVPTATDHRLKIS